MLSSVQEPRSAFPLDGAVIKSTTVQMEAMKLHALWLSKFMYQRLSQILYYHQVIQLDIIQIQIR